MLFVPKRSQSGDDGFVLPADASPRLIAILKRIEDADKELVAAQSDLAKYIAELDSTNRAAKVGKAKVDAKIRHLHAHLKRLAVKTIRATDKRVPPKQAEADAFTAARALSTAKLGLTKLPDEVRAHILRELRKRYPGHTFSGR